MYVSGTREPQDQLAETRKRGPNVLNSTSVFWGRQEGRIVKYTRNGLCDRNVTKTKIVLLYTSNETGPTRAVNITSQFEKPGKLVKKLSYFFF